MNRLKWVLWGSFFCIFIALGVAVFLRDASDFDIFYKASGLALRAQSPYYLDEGSAFTPFKYPPAFTLLFAPLVFFPSEVAKMLWYGINVLSLGLSVFFLNKLWKDLGFSHGVRSTLIALFLSAPFMIYHLSVGQSKLLMLFFLVLSFYFVERGKNFWGGIIFAFSVLIYFPVILFALFFLWKKDFKFLLGSLAGMVLLFLGIPSVVFGIQGNGFYLREWYQTLIGPYLAHPESLGYEGYGVLKLSSQSLASTLARLFSLRPGGKWSLYLHENLLDLSPGTVNHLIKILSFLMVALSCGVLLRKADQRMRLLEYSLFFLLTILLPGYSITYNWALLFVPYLALLGYGADERSQPMGRKLGFIFGALCVLSTTSVACDFLRAYSVLFWGTFSLWLGILLILFLELKTNEQAS